MVKIIGLFAFMLLALSSFSQSNFIVSGKVLDEIGQPLPGCHVHCAEVCVITNQAGVFEVDSRVNDLVTLRFSFMGYEMLDTVLKSNLDKPLTIILKEDSHGLAEIAIQSNAINRNKTQNTKVVESNYLEQNLDGNFVKSMTKISGVNSIDIGASSSKPIIRGMGFNRVAVSENGIKQESQQWGADHGLEMDPFAIEQVEIIKGGSSIEYGSDAIGGVLNINNQTLPINGEINGEIGLLGRTVNNTLGATFLLSQRKNKFFYKGRASIMDYGDYAIPTDTIVYLSRKIPIHNQHLKNTAGREYSLNGQVGWVSSFFKTTFTLSNVNQKSGFFPGSHGIPNEDAVKDDGDARNIELPYQWVNHFKFQNNSKWYFDNQTLFVDAGYQNNHRQEWSSFHSHYPGQEIPNLNSDLEFDFVLQTYSLNAKYLWNLERHKLAVGLQQQYSSNKVGGYNFFLPAYQRWSTALYVKDEWQLSERTSLSGGLRLDYGLYRGEAYYDSVVYNYVLSKPGYTAEDADYYAQRALDVQRNYPGFSWQLGILQKWREAWLFRWNLGKAFRMPNAVELGANGVHHGSFRYERGNPDLAMEAGYFTDIQAEISTPGFKMELGYYSYYFQNYLYLQPTGDLNHPLPDAGAIYEYQQSKALVSGAELSLQKGFSDRFELLAMLELPYNYLINENGDLSYGIPFSPPVNGYVEAKYLFSEKLSANVNMKWGLKVDRSRGQGEEITPGYSLYGFGLHWKAAIKNQPIELSLSGTNLLNTKYFNHMSVYRKLDIPEMGRNIQLLVKVPISVDIRK